MSRRYTDEEKAAALQQLYENMDNVALTATQIGIPSRTLQEWKREITNHAFNNTPDDLLLKNFAQQQQQEDKDGEYTRIQKRLMEHIATLTETLMDDPHVALLRANVLSRLLDRVIKLQKLVKEEQGPKRVEITVTRVDSRNPNN